MGRTLSVMLVTLRMHKSFYSANTVELCFTVGSRNGSVRATFFSTPVCFEISFTISAFVMLFEVFVNTIKNMNFI